LSRRAPKRRGPLATAERKPIRALARGRLFGGRRGANPAPGRPLLTKITYAKGVSMSNSLIFALVAPMAAIVSGAGSIRWLLAKPAGNPRMQEIAAPIQAGAKA